MILTEHKRKTVKLTKPANPWKWAFAILLGLVIAFFMFVFVKVTTPSVDQNRIVEKTEASADKYADLSVSMNKDQLEAAINYYLKKNQTKNSIRYRFLLDKSAILMGTTRILGAKVSFTLYTKHRFDCQIGGNRFFECTARLCFGIRQKQLRSWTLGQN